MNLKFNFKKKKNQNAEEIYSLDFFFFNIWLKYFTNLKNKIIDIPPRKKLLKSKLKKNRMKKQKLY